jgi:integrase
VTDTNVFQLSQHVHAGRPFELVAEDLADGAGRRDHRLHALRQVGLAQTLEVTILTALRTSEVIGATWSEIDLAERSWTIPGQRIKGGKAHRVPLSDEVVAILTALPREVDSEFVFIGGKAGRPLSNMAMLELLRGLRPDLTVHGFRSTFRDWASETTNHPNHVVEQALAHVIGNAVEAAYRRGDLFAKRQRLMAEWARYCGQPIRSPP